MRVTSFIIYDIINILNEHIHHILIILITNTITHITASFLEYFELFEDVKRYMQIRGHVCTYVIGVPFNIIMD